MYNSDHLEVKLNENVIICTYNVLNLNVTNIALSTMFRKTYVILEIVMV